MKDYKERLDQLDDRLKTLMKKYPLVFAACVIGGAVIGFALGAWIF